MKKSILGALLVLAVGAWMADEALAQVNAAQAKGVADSIKFIGVKRMEITTTEQNEYVALVDVAFENGGNQGVALKDADINVFFDIKGGKRIIKEPGEKSDVKAVVESGGKEVGEIKTIRVEKTGKVLFGTTQLKDEEWEFKPGDAKGPNKMEKTLEIKVGKVGDAGTEEKIRRIMNIMGDPKTEFVMILEIRAFVGLGFESGYMYADETNKSLITKKVQQSFKNDYLFK